MATNKFTQSQQFSALIEGIQQIGIFDWLKPDSTPRRPNERSYRVSIKNQRMALKPNEVLYFIEAGQVFRQSLPEGKVNRIDGVDEVKAIVFYHGLVALTHAGQLLFLKEFVQDTNKQDQYQWSLLSKSVSRVLASETMLVALSEVSHSLLIFSDPSQAKDPAPVVDSIVENVDQIDLLDEVIIASLRDGGRLKFPLSEACSNQLQWHV